MIADIGTVYMLTCEKGRYIGSTSNMANRMRVHKHFMPQIHDIPWEDWKVSVLFEKKHILKQELRFIERYLIESFEPELNRYYKKPKKIQKFGGGFEDDVLDHVEHDAVFFGYYQRKLNIKS